MRCRICGRRVFLCFHRSEVAHGSFIEKVLEISFEELYRLVNDGKRLKEFVMKESTKRGIHPSVILLSVVRIYRERVREMALRN